MGVALPTVSLAQPAMQPPSEPAPPEQMAPQMPPQQPAMQPPPGSTHAQFISTTDMPWDVTVNQQPACTTPCQLWLPQLSFVTMHSQERHPVRLEVGYLPPQPVVIAAEPLHQGEYATGVTFTALGGSALVTGITLGAVGYGTNDSGMKTAGFITGVSGAAVLVGAIWLLNRALPKAHVQLSGSF